MNKGVAAPRVFEGRAADHGIFVYESADELLARVAVDKSCPVCGCDAGQGANGVSANDRLVVLLQ